ncbi:hypothetical protein [uncultured Jatrophihabitans sp.]|uniref:hypothetical protein n=1 Tax=uncultured Jatrophihabitans sp. TaxID=1610747 RepID=UPI0035C9915A
MPWAGDGGDAARRFGHHAGTMLITSIVAVVYIGLFPPQGVLMFAVPLAVFTFVIVSWLLMRQHDRRLCEQCASHMVLNPAQLAQRQKFRLHLAHVGAQPRFVVPYFAVLIGTNFLTGPVGRGLWALATLSLAYLVMSQTAHRRLQPWCPWCSDGGGGEEVDETPPVLPRDDRELV